MSKRSTNSSAGISVDTYRDDKLYPRIVKAARTLLARGKVVAPVDVLIRMGPLEPKRLEDWRLGRVPYLEKVIDCNRVAEQGAVPSAGDETSSPFGRIRTL